ncbi:MAG: hypothetical protein AAFR11_03205 [Pseudomonadota bacterium]
MGFRSKPPTPEEMKAKRERTRARKSARDLRRVRKLAAEVGEEASDWEAEFLNSLDERLDKYGTAFRDFEKGAPGDALSRLQQQKLKEIAAKSKEVKNAPSAEEAGGPADEAVDPDPRERRRIPSKAAFTVIDGGKS